MRAGKIAWLIGFLLFATLVISLSGAEVRLTAEPSLEAAARNHTNRNSQWQDVKVTVNATENITLCNISMGLADGLVWALEPDWVSTFDDMNISNMSVVGFVWDVNTTSERGAFRIDFNITCNDTAAVQWAHTYLYVDVLNITNVSVPEDAIDNYTNISVMVVSLADVNSNVTVFINGTEARCNPTNLTSQGAACHGEAPYSFGINESGRVELDDFLIWVVSSEGDYWNVSSINISLHPNPWINITGVESALDMSNGWLVVGRPGNLTVTVYNLGGWNDTNVSVEALGSPELHVLANCTLHINETEDFDTCQVRLNATDSYDGLSMNITAQADTGSLARYVHYNLSSFRYAEATVYNITNNSEARVLEYVDLGSHAPNGNDTSIEINIPGNLFTLNETSNSYMLRDIRFWGTILTNGTLFIPSDGLLTWDSIQNISAGDGSAFKLYFHIPYNTTAGIYNGTVYAGAFNSINRHPIRVQINITENGRCEITSPDGAAAGDWDWGTLTENKDYPNSMEVRNVGNGPVSKMVMSYEGSDAEVSWAHNEQALGRGESSSNLIVTLKVPANARFQDGNQYSIGEFRVTCDGETDDSTNVKATIDKASDGDGTGDDGQDGGTGDTGPTIVTPKLSLALLKGYSINQTVRQGGYAKWKVSVCNLDSVKFNTVKVEAEVKKATKTWTVKELTFSKREVRKCTDGILRMDVP